MKKILTVLGARPQFIKAAAVSKVISEQYNGSLQELIIHTGQHYDENMSAVFFKEMNIPNPYCRLNVGGKSHGAMTGEMLIELEQLMLKEKPDIVLIYGDTNSTLAAAISASKLHIPIAHIEAGMRSFDKRIPEEVNRVLSDHVSSIFLCTSNEPANNLIKEGLTNGIHVVGDVMYDLVLSHQSSLKPSAAVANIKAPFYLATCHRQENTDNPENLLSIFYALKQLSSQAQVVIPMHPRTAQHIKKLSIDTSGITILDPLGYFDMLYLTSNAELVITDSGGLQKEAYYCNKPVVVMRDVTEWSELIECGVAKLTGANTEKILSASQELAAIKNFPRNIYGDGKAAEKIVAILNSYRA